MGSRSRFGNRPHKTYAMIVNIGVCSETAAYVVIGLSYLHRWIVAGQKVSPDSC
jgi:hypothetical protein